MPSSIVNPTAAAAFVGLMKAQRVLITGIGNSNTNRSLSGFARAMARCAMDSGFSEWGMGPSSLCETDATTGEHIDSGSIAPVMGINFPLGCGRISTSTGNPGILRPFSATGLSGKVQSSTRAQFRLTYPAAVTNMYEFGQFDTSLFNTQWRALCWTNDTQTENTSRTITSITDGGASNALVTTSVAHGFEVGNVLLLAGTNSTATLNGARTVVTVPSSTTFTVTVAITGAGTTGTAIRNTTASLQTNCQAGISISSNNSGTPLYVQGHDAWLHDVWYANASPLGGTFRPGALTNAVPNTKVIPNEGEDTVVVVPAGTATGMARATRTYPTGPRQNNTLYLQPIRSSAFNEVHPTGQIMFGHHFAHRSIITTGPHVAFIAAQGGVSLTRMQTLLTRTDGEQLRPEAIAHFLDVAIGRPCAAVSQTPAMLFVLKDGSNSATTLSTAQYVASAVVIIDLILAIWIAAGYDSAKCFFAIDPDHPNYTDTEAQQILYRSVALPALAALYPTRFFGFNSNNSWTRERLLNLGMGNATFYSASSSTQTIANSTVVSSGFITLTISSSTGYPSGTLVQLTGSNATPSINGIFSIVDAPSSTTVRILAPATAIGTGAAGTLRTIDSVHLAAAGNASPDATGGTVDGYYEYLKPMWDDMMDAVASSSGSGRASSYVGFGRGRTSL